MKKQKKKGISLIVLVITIVVIIILAVAVILTIAENNPISNARQAVDANEEVAMKEEALILFSDWYMQEKLDSKSTGGSTSGSSGESTGGSSGESTGGISGESTGGSSGESTGGISEENYNLEAENYIKEKLKGKYSDELLSRLRVLANGTITIENPKLKIVCWGDSLTNGVGGGEGENKVSYPKVLQAIFDEENKNVTAEIFNMGIGGETTSTIAGRQGGVPYVVNEFTIPADTSKVKISFEGEDSVVMPWKEYAVGLNPCYINGVEGRITSEEVEALKDYNYYFNRSVAGEEVLVENGTQVITKGMADHKDAYILILWTGSNDSYIKQSDPTTIEATIEKQRKMIKYVGTSKYIIIGLIGRGEGINNKLGAEYGEHYLNISGVYNSQEGFIDSTTDMYDVAHLNAGGYTKVANQVYQKLIDLGYIE